MAGCNSRTVAVWTRKMGFGSFPGKTEKEFGDRFEICPQIPPLEIVRRL